MTTGPTIIQALEDPDLFAGLGPFKKPETWVRWRVFLKALFGLPLDESEVDVFLEHTGRLDWPDEPVKMAAAIIGRRGGKSWVVSVVAVYLALFIEWEQNLSPGERAHVVVIAQSQRAAKTILRYIRGILRGVPVFKEQIGVERADEIDLKNRPVTIGVWPASYRSTRGLTIACAILDELDFYQFEGQNDPAEIVNAIRPAMATLKQSMLLAISSPYTPTGWLYQFHREFYGREHSPYLVWQASSDKMNPTLDPKVIAAAFAEDPERAAAEYGGTWRMGVSGLFDPAALDACARRSPLILSPQPDVRYVAAVDPSGGGADEFCWAVGHREGERIIVDLVSGRGRLGRQGVDLDATVAVCAEALKAYGIHEAFADHYAGSWPSEAFQRHGIMLVRAPRPKSDLYLEMLPLVTAGRVEIPEDIETLKQAKLLQRRRGTQGKDRVEEPRGAHDDRINAVALLPAQLLDRTSEIDFKAQSIIGRPLVMSSWTDSPWDPIRKKPDW